MKIGIKVKDEIGRKALAGLKQQFFALKTGAFVIPTALMNPSRRKGLENLKKTVLIANKETPDLIYFESEVAKTKKDLVRFVETYFSGVRVSKKHYEVIKDDEM